MKCQPTFIRERAHTPIDRVADVVLRWTVTSLSAVLSKKALRTFELAPCACETRRTLAPSVHLVALGAIVAKALVDTVGSESAGGTRLGAVFTHQATGATALASYVVAICVVLTPALLDATFPVETGLAGAGAVGTCEARRADATS